MASPSAPVALPSFRRSFTTLFSGSLVAQLLTAAASLIVARALGPDRFAPLAAGLAVATLTAPLFTLGMDGWLLQQGRFGADVLARSNSSALAVRVLLGLLWLLILPLVVHRVWPTTYPLLLVAVVAGAVWLENLLALVLSALKARLDNRSTAQVMVVGALLLFGITLLLARRDAPALDYASGRVAVAVVAGGMALGLLGRGNMRRPSWAKNRSFLVAALPFWLSEALFVLYQRADATILAVRVGVEPLAQYAPATAVVSALYLMPNIVYSVIVPRLSHTLTKPHRRDTLAPTVRRLLAGMAILGVLLSVGTAVIAGPLMALVLGPAYREAGVLLQILAALLFFKCLSFGAAALLVVGGWQDRRTVVQGAVALFSIIANWVLAPLVGVRGVAWLFVASDALLALGYLALLWRWWRQGALSPT